MSLSEIEELQSLIRSHNGDQQKLKRVMSRVMANVYVGKDMSSLFPDIVLQVQIKESSIKRLIGMYTTQYGHLHPETALLCINQLIKEAMHDTDAIQRGHALQTLTSLNIPSLAEYIAPPIKLAFQDSSSYVRRLAVVGCVKIHNINKDVFDEQLLSLHLEELIDDFDERVSTVAVIALIQTKPGFKLQNMLAIRLLKRLNNFTDWQVPLIVDAIDTEHLCASDKDVMEVINLVDGYLDDCSAAVVLHVIKMLKPIIETLKDNEMKSQFIDRVKSPLLFRVKHSNPEIAYWFCLQIPAIIKDISIFSSDYKTFFPMFYDPAYLKAEKIKFLSLILNDSNVKSTVRNLLECLISPKHADIASEVVECVTMCVLQYGHKISSLVVQLGSILQSGTGPIVSTLLPCIEKIVMSLDDSAQVILPQLQRCAEFDLSSEANIALLSMLAFHGSMLPECVSMLYCYVEEYSNLDNQVRMALLSTCVKQYNLPGLSKIVAKLMSLIEADDDPLLKSRATMYSTLLMKKLTHLAKPLTAPKIVTVPKKSFTFEDYPVLQLFPDIIPTTTPDTKNTLAQTRNTSDITNLLDINEPLPAQSNNNSVYTELDDILGLGAPDNKIPQKNTTSEKPGGTPQIDDVVSIFDPKVTKQPVKPLSLSVLSPEKVKASQSAKNFLQTLSLSTVSPQVYEENWGKNWKPEKFKVALNTTNLTVDSEISAMFMNHRISTMAITPTNVDPQQVFLYSNSAGSLILMKIQISFIHNTFEIEARSANTMIAQMATKAIRYLIDVL